MIEESRSRVYARYLNQACGRHKYVEETVDIHWFRYRAYYGPFLPEDRRARIVDLGCGSGSFVAWLRSLGYVCAMGVDGNVAQIEAGRKHGVEGLSCDDVFRYLSSARDLDVVTAHDLLEHFAKDEILRLLDLCRQALRPGGLLIASVPNGMNPGVGRVFFGDFSHETCFTPSSLQQVLEITGFQRIRILPKEPVVHGLASAVRRALWIGMRGAIGWFYLISAGFRPDPIYTETMFAVAER